MKHPVLNANERVVFGKKVKHLRRDGLLPANVYGKGLASKALQVKISDFQEVFKQVGETGLVELKIGEQKSYPVLIKNLQMDYFTESPLHADFYKVNLKEKVRTMVPIDLVGESKAVREKIGVLLQTLSEVEVEALPDRIPEHIEVNIEPLDQIGAGITVQDLKTQEGVAILTEPGVTVVHIAEPAKEEEPVVVAEEIPAEGEEGKTEKEAASPATGAAQGEKGSEKPQEKQEK